jgi:hypothetical protein
VRLVPCLPCVLQAQVGQKLSDAAYSGDIKGLGELIASGLNVNACDQVRVPRG